STCYYLIWFGNHVFISVMHVKDQSKCQGIRVTAAARASYKPGFNFQAVAIHWQGSKANGGRFQILKKLKGVILSATCTKKEQITSNGSFYVPELPPYPFSVKYEYGYEQPNGTARQWNKSIG
ncbi:hypothetical protein ACJX0J_026982, partial [Zea mays]